MHIVHPDIETYLDSLDQPRDPVFREMERLAAERKFPAVGPQVGRLLFMLARTMGARNILELGSGFGYSAVWFGKALPPGGKLMLTDLDENNAALARRFWGQAGLEAEMTFLVGNALTLLMKQEGPFDIIFNDVDKEDYPDTIDPVYQRLRPGGLFITDNTLWYARWRRRNRMKPPARSRNSTRL